MCEKAADQLKITTCMDICNKCMFVFTGANKCILKYDLRFSFQSLLLWCILPTYLGSLKIILISLLGTDFM